MKVSFRKIKEFISTSLSASDVAVVLTATGLEIEGVETVDDVPGGMRGLVVGHITECEQHPNADRLRCCKVDIGTKVLDIVCGAPNAATGLKVLVATVGTTLHSLKGEPFKINKGKIRGEVSLGMLCGEDEVGIGESSGGIMELDSKWNVGTLASEVFEVGSDEVFEIGLTPNRNDAMGHLGVARDLRAGLMHGTVSEFVDTDHDKVRFPEGENLDLLSGIKGLTVSIEAKDLAPRYVLVGMEGVKIAPSPDHAQRFLRSIGVAPINNVVDATNYVLHELGQPLHAFDWDTVSGNKLQVRLAKKGEKITTLDGVERKLDTADLVIANADEVMCIAGVFGSEKHGVSDSTTRVLLESANFNPVSVRKSAKRHGLSTDASFRFERQVDPNAVLNAAERAAALICEWSGGNVVGAVVNGDADEVMGAAVELDWEMLDRIVGVQLDRERVKSILDALDIMVASESKDGLKLEVPAYRSDVTRAADIVEEILRIHGFDQIEIPSRISSTLEIPTRPDREDEMFGWASTLVARGFNEIMSNSLTKALYSERCWKDPDLNPKYTVAILNPLSSDLGVMRQSLVFQGIEAIARNINHRSSDLRFFELGRTYHKLKDGYKETEHLSLWISGKKTGENWGTGGEDADVFTLKEAVSVILTQVGIARKVRERVDTGGLMLEGNEILMGDNVIGRFGQVHPDVTDMCDVEVPVYWADLLVKPLLKARKKRNIVARELAKFPSVRRDLSLILDKSVKFEDIKAAAEDAERKLLVGVNLFDVYEGDKLEKGKVSYAVSLVLQDPTKTLTDKHIDNSVARILESIAEKTGASLR